MLNDETEVSIDVQAEFFIGVQVGEENILRRM